MVILELRLELRVEDRKGKKVSSINGDKPVQEKKEVYYTWSIHDLQIKSTKKSCNM
jgi:hypothetical protein